MGAPPLTSGRLPLGRWTVEVADLAEFVALPDSAHRAAVFNDWTRLTETLRRVTGGVAACWLSGSFFTTKPEPADLDCLYVIDHQNLARARADVTAAKFLQIVAKSQVKSVLGLRVDSYVLPWWPHAGTDAGPSDRGEQYLLPRGYWDDFWSRERHQDPRTSALPRRGYLEVILDGYR